MVARDGRMLIELPNDVLFDPARRVDGAIVGPDYGVSLSGLYFNNRKTTIYGGSNEIQKNIISKMILGL